MGIFDIVKPKWQHSDPNVRIKEIKNLGDSNQPIIDSIAQRDKNADVRRIAIKKVNSLDVLIAISKNDSDDDLRLIAKQRYSESIVKDLKKLSENKEAEELFKKLDDTKSIEEVALTAKSDAVREKAIKLVEKESILARLAKEDKSQAVADAAVVKISKLNLLVEVLKYSRHASVRSVASKAISVIEGKDKKDEHSKFEERKRDVLLKTLNDLYNNENIREKLSEVESMYVEGKKLLASASQDFKNSLEQKFQDIKTKIESAEKAYREKIAQNEENQAVAEECKEVCETIEEQLNLGKENIVADRLEEIKTEWAAVEEKHADSPVVAEYSARFAKTVNRIDSMFQEIENEKLDEVKTSERRKELFDQLLLLKDSVDSNTFLKQVKSIDGRWNALGDVAERDSEIAQEYQKVRKDLDVESEKSHEAHRTSLKEKVSKLESICAEVEGLDENDQFQTILQTLRDKYQEWKSVVGEDKSQFQKMYQRFQQATARFNEMREWELWHNEKEKNKVIEDAQTLGTIEDDKELFITINKLKAKWRSIGHVPVNIVEDVWQRFNDALEPHLERCTEFLKQQEEEFEENYKIKQKIIESIKSAVASVENWKEQSVVVKNLQEEWKSVGFVAKDKLKELQEAYRSTCDAFYEKKRTFLKNEDEKRHLNLEQKTVLCEEAEQVMDSDQWKDTTEKLKELQKRWKTIGPVPKEQSDVIWARFRKSCDAFFENKRVYFEKIEEGRVDNLKKKEDICTRLETETLDPTNAEDVATFEAIKKEWASIGHVPKDESDVVFERFVKSCDEFLEKQIESDPVLKAEVDKKKEQKRDLIQQASELVESSDWKETSDKLKDLQQEWKDIGRVGIEDPELWKEFRVQCDEFFTRKRDTYEILQQNRLNNLDGKKTLCEQAERLAQREFDEEIIREAKLLRERWKEIGAVPRRDSDKIWKRFNAACDAVFDKRKAAREAEEA